MSIEGRKALYTMLIRLSRKLDDIADDTDDIETSDKIKELVDVISKSTDQLLFNMR